MNTETFTAERRPGTYRAVLIDPWARTVTVGWIDQGLQPIYATLSGPGFPTAETFPTDPREWTGDYADRESVPVSCIDIRSVGMDRYGQPVDLICDDEGRLKGNMACFRMGDDLLIAGRALFASHDDEGETTSTGLALHEAVKPISWAPWDTNYTNPPMRFVGAEPGESFEELLERAQREHLADGL